METLESPHSGCWWRVKWSNNFKSGHCCGPIDTHFNFKTADATTTTTTTTQSCSNNYKLDLNSRWFHTQINIEENKLQIAITKKAYWLYCLVNKTTAAVTIHLWLQTNIIIIVVEVAQTRNYLYCNRGWPPPVYWFLYPPLFKCRHTTIRCPF